jgi:hypothetical protein
MFATEHKTLRGKLKIEILSFPRSCQLINPLSRSSPYLPIDLRQDFYCFYLSFM